MTRSRSLRLYRACQRCRQRKLKCEPTTAPDGTKSSCRECLRADEECVLAGSRRGGDFSRFRRSRRNQIPTSSCSTPTLGHVEMAGCELTGQMNGYHEKGPEDPIYAELTNPGDALQILARLAANGARISNHPNDSISTDPVARDFSSRAAQAEDISTSGKPLESTRPPVMLSETETLVIGMLGADTTTGLLHHYATNYHPFSPLATKRLLASTDLRKAAADEPFLLAVILTIASKEEPAYRDIHRRCWYDVKRQLLDILLASPSTLNVGSVEGLLLLAEWVPYLQFETCSYPMPPSANPSAVEDNMAWSLIGQAVRHSYLLRLDKASFRDTVHEEPQELENRRRLAWIFVYIADRQISVRMGQSFWSRGPSLSSHFTARDFPSLRLGGDAEHNYAFVLQASMELTQLLHNMHDILYSSKERRMHMVLRGDYNRYLDDFRHSISVWQDRWDQLKTSPKLNCTLRILKEYVRLYANAFSFQSILSRAVHDNCITGTMAPRPKQAPSLFPQGIMASPDGAYAFEALDAARAILIIVSQADPVAQIRYMPFRFYVYDLEAQYFKYAFPDFGDRYIIYSAVFLYKADFFGTFSRAERTEIAHLVQQITHVLEEAAASDSHIGSRYAKLLTQMWLSGENKPGAQNNNVNGPSVHSGDPLPIFSRLDGEYYNAASDLRIPEAMNMLTPDFNLFNQDFSNPGAELFDLGTGGFGFPL